MKNNGSRAHTYKIKPIGNDTVVVHAEATSTSAADFAITKLKPTLYKRAVPKKEVSGITAEVVQP